MDEWPPFVVENPAGEARAGRGWEGVVFELEDSVLDAEGDQLSFLRDA
ncbi:MAG TPA: hypothetical protein VFV54_00930 [Thermoanaerobaculia bacterium]|nr:hypothetical protein [Thermoanaerobaculia bacterium]